MKDKYVIIFAVLSVFQSVVAEPKEEFIAEKEVIFFNENKNAITLYLGNYGSGQGVIVSPDKSLKGLPYEIGIMKYGYYQPYIFTPNASSSQVMLIPYMTSGGTGVAWGDWCLAVSKNKNVYIERLGTWHYHCCGPREDFFSFDVLPSFYGTLVFLYEERIEGAVKFIKGDVDLKIIVDKDGVKANLEPCRVEDALKIADLLAKHGCIKEWALECLSNEFADEMKQLKSYEDKIPSKVVEDLKKKIKQFYDRQNEE